jgi:hypothetical protein
VKKSKQVLKKEQRVQRLVARLTLMNSDPPQFGWSDHRRQTWRRERANLLRQLKKHGIEMG